MGEGGAGVDRGLKRRIGIFVIGLAVVIPVLCILEDQPDRVPSRAELLDRYGHWHGLYEVETMQVDCTTETAEPPPFVAIRAVLRGHGHVVAQGCWSADGCREWLDRSALAQSGLGHDLGRWDDTTGQAAAGLAELLGESWLNYTGRGAELVASASFAASNSPGPCLRSQVQGTISREGNVTIYTRTLHQTRTSDADCSAETAPPPTPDSCVAAVHLRLRPAARGAAASPR